MTLRNPKAVVALISAGVLWGLTVPLSKLSLGWLGPEWLTAARFGIAAVPLAVAGRRGLRAALTPRVVGAGMIGFGAVILLQNAGIERTSVSEAAVLVGAVPVLVGLIAFVARAGAVQPLGWGGYALALGGVALVAHVGGGGAAPTGDLLVLASAVLSALLIVIQPRLLAGRDATAVTAVQFAAAALFAAPVALVAHGLPAAAPARGPVLALASLAILGTLLPFWLFAYGQARVPPQIAGAYVNLEPVVGAVAGWAWFGEAAGGGQVAGAAAVLGGIVLSTFAAGRTRVGSPPRAWPRRRRTHRAGADAEALRSGAAASTPGGRWALPVPRYSRVWRARPVPGAWSRRRSAQCGGRRPATGDRLSDTAASRPRPAPAHSSRDRRRARTR